MYDFVTDVVTTTEHHTLNIHLWLLGSGHLGTPQLSSKNNLNGSIDHLESKLNKETLQVNEDMLRPNWRSSQLTISGVEGGGGSLLYPSHSRSGSCGLTVSSQTSRSAIVYVPWQPVLKFSMSRWGINLPHLLWICHWNLLQTCKYSAGQAF